MALNRCLNKLPICKRINYCYLCSKSETIIDSAETSLEHEKVPKGKTKQKRTFPVNSPSHLREMAEFFNENHNVAIYKDFLPTKIWASKPYKTPDYFYLVCPNTAKKIAKEVVQRLHGGNQVIAESNPGLGLITDALLQKGVSFVRLYELNIEFQDYLLDAFRDRNTRISLYKKDLFTLWRYAYCDSLDQGQRVARLLEGVPKKSWSDDPVMAIVGTLTKQTFLNYLIKCIVLQRDLVTYGRVELFLITYEKLWRTFKATKDDSLRVYKASSILLQIFFEAELIDKYPRKFFLPWQTVKKTNRTHTLDPENLYLIKVTMKKEFPLHADQLVPFYCFMMTLYGLGNSLVISTCEKWVPGCGENLILPKLEHQDYYEDIGIFTKFRELNPMQIIGVFRELATHPNYLSSPFMDMVEEEWLKSETIETDLNDAHIESPL